MNPSKINQKLFDENISVCSARKWWKIVEMIITTIRKNWVNQNENWNVDENSRHNYLVWYASDIIFMNIKEKN